LLSGVLLAHKKGLPSDKAGIEIMEVNRRSRAAYYGLQPGDIIQGVGRYRVRNFEEFEQALPDRRRTLVLLIRRNNDQFLIEIR
jgi:S1-C subfamily serine protease